MREGTSRGRWPARLVVMGTIAALATAAVIAALTPVLGGHSTPAGPGAVLYVSPTGSDGAPCTAAAPCAGFDRAYHVAAPGQVVQVAGGTYPLQIVTADATKLAGPDVTFRSAPGQLAILSAGLVVKQASHITFVGNSVATAQTLVGATSGLTLMPTPNVINSGAGAGVTQCSDHITFRNVDARQLGVNNSSYVTVTGGSLGGHNNSGDDSTVTPAYFSADSAACPNANPSNILFSGVLFHDVGRELYPTAHPDCLQISGTTGTVIERSTFIRCGTSNILARPAVSIWPGAQLTGLVIRNNFFAPLAEGGNQILLGAPADRCGTIDLLYNTSAADALASLTCGSYESLRVIGNYERSQQRYTCLQQLSKATVYDANMIGFVGGALGVTSCGTHSRLTGDPRFVNEAAFDYRIQRGSPLIGAGTTAVAPPNDIDGKLRPLRAAPDAGASQWDSATLVVGRSIGLAAIGMTRDEVEKSYGTARTVAPAGGGLTQATYVAHGGVVRVTYAGDRIVGVSTTSPYYTRDTEPGVGSRLPTRTSLHWLRCRSAFVRTRQSVAEVFVPRGGRSGKSIAAVGWYRPGVSLCGRGT
jgi:hypothetical protein